ncbi:MAG TPA: hypothetical protein VE817_11320 [Candidatus Acidoferrum sp.]|nr:hypothetical protein [Candidatus Acidoferrum sp.]
MSGTTRKIQQPASTGSLLAAIGMATAVVAAVVAISWGSANIGKATQAAPAPFTAPAAHDLGSRDEGAAALGSANMIHDRGSSEAATVIAGSNGYNGFGNRAHRPTTSTTGSTGVVPARRNPAFLPR